MLGVSLVGACVVWGSWGRLLASCARLRAALVVEFRGPSRGATWFGSKKRLTGDVFGMPSPSHADLPLPSSDDIMASVTSALASRSEIDTTPTDVSDNVAVTEPGPAGTFTGNKEDDRSELVEAMQLDISHPSSVNVDAENEIDQLPTKPAARHHSVAEDTLVASPESEEVQQVARNTLPTVSDQIPPSDHDHPEEALA